MGGDAAGDAKALAVEPVKQESSKEGAAAADEKKPQDSVSWFKLLSGADKMDQIFMLVGTIGGIGNGLAWPIFAILFADFTDAFGAPSTGNFMDSITKVALNFLWLGLGSMVGQYLQGAFWMWAGHRQTGRLRVRYLHAVLRQDMAYFDTTATTGGLLQGLNENSNDVQAAISEKVGYFIQHMVTFVGGIIVAFIGGWDMTLVMIGTLPFLGLCGAIMARVTAVMGAKSTEAYAGASALLQQSLSQIRTVAAYGAEERALKAYSEALEQPTRLGVLSGVYSGLALGAVNTIVYWTYAIGFVYGAWRVSLGKYTGGDVLQVLLAVLLGGFSLGQAAPIFETFSKGCAAAANIFRVIDRVPAIDPESEEGEVLPEEKMEGAIELRDVVFSYPVRPEVRVFHGFSLVMPGGQSTALVGSSGSGKSTTVALVQRFYDPEQGAVLLDGVDIRRLNLKWLRGHIGLVSQEPTLFATTIGENIAMGRPGATEEEIQRAAELANAHNFISLLPLAYQTHVGERGLQLSGGQKQRIAIARAILKNPRILLLDEATSALDTRSEQLVQAALDNMIQGRTTIVVAHRLSTIRNANNIAVVRAGQVVELGTHTQLISNPDGAYTALVKLQMQEEQERKKKEEVDEEIDEEDGDEADELEGVPEEPEDLEGASESSSSKALPKLAAAAAAAPGAVTVTAARTSSDATTPSAAAAAGPAAAGPAPAAVAAGDVELAVPTKPAADAAAPAPDAAAAGTLEVVVAAATSGAAAAPVDASKEPHGHAKKHGRHRKHRSKKAGGEEGDKDKKKKKKKDKEEEEVKVPFSRLAALNKPEWPFAVPALVGAALLGLLQPAFAYLMSEFVNLFYNTDLSYVKSQASFWAWMFFVIGWGNLVATLLKMAGFGKMGAELSRRVRTMMLKNMLYQEIGWFDEEGNSSGTLTSKLATDAAHIRGAVADTVGLFFQNAVTLVSGYALALAFEWRIALVVTGALPFMISGSILYFMAVTNADAGSSELFGAANQAVSDAFTSIRVVQSYRLQDHMTMLYQRLTSEADRKGEKKAHIMGGLMAYSQFTIFAVYALIVWFGGVEVDSGRATFKEFLVSFLALLLAAFGIAQAQVGFPDVGKAKDAVRNVFPILDRKSKIDASDPTGVAWDNFEGAIELRAVKFAYPNRPSVLVFKEFSLSIPAGKQVALVGESGSGKSTVVGLVLRYYDVLAGEVLVDGTDVRQYNLRFLRSHVGLVSQEPLLFSTTVLANITFGRPDASMDEVEAAARVANAHDFIAALPDGFHTAIGEKGVQLSGGQKQRIAIARAVLKNPKILLLDEATSALDAASERVVQDALDKVMVGRTSVVVAHRLSTIRNADKIALVHRGHILEQGTHAELMALPDGGYSRLVAAQNREGGGGGEASAGATPARGMSKQRTKGSKSNLAASASQGNLAASASQDDLQQAAAAAGGADAGAGAGAAGKGE